MQARKAEASRKRLAFRILVNALLLLTGTCSTARADEPPVELEWNTPDGEHCPTARAVLAQVSKLVEATRPNERADVRVRADVRKLGEGRFRVELTTLVDGKKGRRVIEERSCAAMAEATVLILAWMVDPRVLDVAEPPKPAPPPPPPAKPPAPPPAPPPERRAVELVFGVGAVADLGTMPSLAVGVGLIPGVRGSWWRLQAHGELWAHQTSRVPGTDAGASFGLLSAGLDLCAVPWRLDFGFCAGPELDRLEGTGFGVDSPRTDHAIWLALGAGAVARIPVVGPLSIGAGLRAVIPQRRERFGLDGVGDVHRPAAVAGRAFLGLDAHF